MPPKPLPVTCPACGECGTLIETRVYDGVRAVYYCAVCSHGWETPIDVSGHVMHGP